MQDTDLKMAAIAQVTIMDAQNLVDELERIRMAYAKQLGALSLILKAFGDLYCELTDKTADRKWLSNQINQAEREANRLQIPAWFWRIDKELPLDDQLYRRSKWLLQEKRGIHMDDLWDCMTDALEYSGIPLNVPELTGIVKRARNASSS
jgi:hypothetical protein